MKFDKRKLLSDSIYKYIRSNISNGTWKPDKQINEQKVADTLFVSRTPVRQALQRAYNEGLLGYNKYVGYFVVGNKREDIIEVFAIRIALEALQCYRAACNMSEGNWQKLQEINAEIRAISEHEGDYNCLYCLNEEFCAIIQQSAGMQRLPRFQELLSNYLHDYKAWFINNMERNDRAFWQYNDNLLAAMRQFDHAAIYRIVEQRWLDYRDYLLQQFSKNEN